MRVYVSHHLKRHIFVPLDSGQSHHIVRVLRKRHDDTLEVFNGKDGVWTARLRVQHRGCVLWIMDSIIPQPVDDPSWLHICMPILKDRCMEYALQKATEMGVHRFSFVRSEYTQKRLPRADQWMSWVRAACAQSHRLHIPMVDNTLSSLEDLVDDDDSLPIVCERASPSADSPSCAHVTSSMLRQAVSHGQCVRIFVGPEGGWSEKDSAILRKRGHPLSLGSNILRAETAVLAACAIVYHKVFNAHAGRHTL